MIDNRRNHEWTHMSKEEQEDVRKNEPARLPKWVNKKWHCEKCGKGFTHQCGLKHHIKYLHEGNKSDNPYKSCGECGKKVRNLKDHLLFKHEAIARFECTINGCGKKFKYVSAKKKHQNVVHRNIRPWKCSKCEKEFCTKENLKRHMGSHLEVRRWKCGEEGCQEEFTKKKELKDHHKRVHWMEGN